MKKLVLVSLLLFFAITAVGADENSKLRSLMNNRSKLLSEQRLKEIDALLKAEPSLANKSFKRIYGSGLNTPLNEALSLGDPGLVAVLLENGANPNRASGRTEMRPLQWAMNDTLDPDKIEKSVMLLLAKGSDPNLTDKRSSSALHRWAARTMWRNDPAYLSIGKALLEAGAKVAGDPKSLSSPLQVAVININPVAVKFLLEHGADPNRKTGLGTALELAETEAGRMAAEEEAAGVLEMIKGRR